MPDVVLDASAVLAVLRREPGAEAVVPHLRGGYLSTVNLSEVIPRGLAIGLEAEVVVSTLYDLGIRCVHFTETHALLAASLRASTQRLDISFADRACIALAMDNGLPALTGDSVWSTAGLAVEIRLFR